jgi:four helix bundle protein
METAHFFAFQKLDVYVAAKELAARIHRARVADAELRDQATRASKSAFLCLAEGLPNDGAGMRRKYFVMANNSLHEAVAAVDLAAAIGALATAESEAILALGLRVKRMLRALMR